MAIKNPYNYTMPKTAMKFRINSDKKTSVNINSNTSTVKPKTKIDYYKEQTIMTSKPEELTLMLYNGIIKFLNQAKIFIDQKNVEKTHNAIVRAQDIITELNITLNMDYEISKSLRSLYNFMNSRLVQANIQKDKNIIDEVLGLAEEMRDTWKQAIGLVATGKLSDLTKE